MIIILTVVIFFLFQMSEMDDLIFLGQCAQDPLIGLNEPWSPESGILSKKRKLKKQDQKGETSTSQPKKRRQMSQCLSSYVVNNQVNRGRKLIKIQVIDLQDSEVKLDNNDNVLLSAQYIVKDCIDDILDQTESLITNISKKVCGYSF